MPDKKGGAKKCGSDAPTAPAPAPAPIAVPATINLSHQWSHIILKRLCARYSHNCECAPAITAY